MRSCSCPSQSGICFSSFKDNLYLYLDIQTIYLLTLAGALEPLVPWIFLCFFLRSVLGSQQNLRGKYRDFPSTRCPHTCIVSTVSIPHQSAMFVPVDEPTKSIIYNRAYIGVVQSTDLDKCIMTFIIISYFHNSEIHHK